MADKVNQNVNLVLADQFDQAIVREINSPAPLVSGVPKMRRQVIFLSRIRIADDLELLRIVVNDDPSKCVGRRLMTKMAAHISDAKLTLRARLVQMVGTKASNEAPIWRVLFAGSRVSLRDRS